MHSIKLTRMPFGTDQLSLKVAYERNGTPNPANPLNGFLDYSQLSAVAQTLCCTAAVPDPVRGHAHARNALLGKLAVELPRQNVTRGKFKLTFKPARATTGGAVSSVSHAGISHAGMKARFRIAGNVTDAAINHGHFQASQKSSATGDSVELLTWIIKLDHVAGPDTACIRAALADPSLRAEIERVVRHGLARVDVLELVIDATAQLVLQVRAENDLPIFEVKLSLQRPGLLDHAVAVIGKTIDFTTAGALQAPARKSGVARRYRDFGNAARITSFTDAPPGIGPAADLRRSDSM